jgi:phosphoribosylformimino-5-aminoimidazole carboxamide ribonucleotide (ProFAR) isomerase
MEIHIHIHHHGNDKQDLIISKLNKIMSTQQEIADGLTQATEQLKKIGTESTATLKKVIDLEAALANQPGVTPELQTAFDALKVQVQVVDDLVPDAPVDGQ